MARETREAWARRIARWQRSGLTAERFAAREGVNPRTLTFWKWKLGRDGGNATPPPARDGGDTGRVAFVELLGATVAAAAPPFEVVLGGGYRVSVAPGFDGAALRTLLDVLEARR